MLLPRAALMKKMLSVAFLIGGTPGTLFSNVSAVRVLRSNTAHDESSSLVQCGTKCCLCGVAVGCMACCTLPSSATVATSEPALALGSISKLVGAGATACANVVTAAGNTAAWAIEHPGAVCCCIAAPIAAVTCCMKPGDKMAVDVDAGGLGRLQACTSICGYSGQRTTLFRRQKQNSGSPMLLDGSDK
ncbi:unnamed protein product [Amoebophrya sp. A120]|nr:unnamed protein product [Amoebophrya sp. A120]|eukprot:GSA120T00011570001.1